MRRRFTYVSGPPFYAATSGLNRCFQGSKHSFMKNKGNHLFLVEWNGIPKRKRSGLLLTAWRDDKKMIYLAEDYPLDMLKKWRRTYRFYCPVCKERLDLKLGQIKIFHFPIKETITAFIKESRNRIIIWKEKDNCISG
jgi:hypothetical protein